MKKNKSKTNAHELCEELREDDGVSSKDLVKKEQYKNEDHHQHRTRQLCKEAFRTIDLALNCDCHDPLLQQLEILSVEPIESSPNLMVILKAGEELGESEINEALKRIQQWNGHLRSQVAHSVNRKQIPNLTYRIMPYAD
jgi:ribosome-binding factor A